MALDDVCVTTLTLMAKRTNGESHNSWDRFLLHHVDYLCPNSMAQSVKAGYQTYGINVSEESPGKHWVPHQIDNPAMIQYLRDSVKAYSIND